MYFDDDDDLDNSTYALDMLDVHLTVEARRLNKTVGSLETANSHCEVIDSSLILLSKEFPICLT